MKKTENSKHKAEQEIEQRIKRGEPMPVTAVRVHNKQSTCYAICPACGITMEREYSNYCSYCGQRLCWDQFVDGKIQVIFGPRARKNS